MGKVWKPAVWGWVGVLLLGAGCKQQPSAAENEQTIRSLDAQWAKTAAAHDLEGTVAYYTEDAVLLPPNEPLVSGKQAIRASWTTLLSPNIALAWQATRVDVSQSGDLAYLVGTYELSTKDAQGKRVSDRGKLIEVFRKQSDGTWKTVADMYNSDLPAPPA